MRNDYLKYVFKKESLTLLILSIVIIGINNQATLLIFLSLMLTGCVTGEYLVLSNMMRTTRKEVYKNINEGIFLLAGIFTMVNIILEKITSPEIILGDGIIGVVLLYFIFMFNLSLGIRLSVYTTDSIDLKDKKKTAIMIGVFTIIIIVIITLIYIGIVFFSDPNARMMLGKYKFILGCGVSILLLIISLLINKSIKKNILRREWS